MFVGTQGAVEVACSYVKDSGSAAFHLLLKYIQGIHLETKRQDYPIMIFVISPEHATF